MPFIRSDSNYKKTLDAECSVQRQIDFNVGGGDLRDTSKN